MKISLYGFRQIGVENSELLAVHLARMTPCMECGVCEVAIVDNSEADLIKPPKMLAVVRGACRDDSEMAFNALNNYMKNFSFHEMVVALCSDSN